MPADKPFAGQNVRNLSPVYDPRNHKLLGYRDRAGRDWTPDGKKAAGLPSGGYGGYQTGMNQTQKDQVNQWLDVETKAEQEKRRNDQKVDSAANGTLPAGQERIWVDGKLVVVTKNSDGTYTSKPADKPSADPSPYGVPTAFDALDGQSVDPAAPFFMGYVTRSQTGGSATGMPAPGTVTRNMMTVGASAAWLAELSTKDPGAYQAMLDKLHSAAYLSDADYAAAAGHWSAQAGQAFALAARDTAVVNTTVQGHFTTLAQFLDSKQGALDAAKAGSYTPTARSYTDPEDIKASAKTEAEKVLGRHLTSDEEAQLVSHYRSLEDAAFDQIDAAQGKGGARYTPPGVGQIGAYVSGPEHEQEAANFRAAGYGMALKRLVGLN